MNILWLTSYYITCAALKNSEYYFMHYDASTSASVAMETSAGSVFLINFPVNQALISGG